MTGNRFVLVGTGTSYNTSSLFYIINPVFSGEHIAESSLPVLWSPIVLQKTPLGEASGAYYYYVRDLPVTLFKVDHRIVKSSACTYADTTDRYGNISRKWVIPEADLPNFIVDFYAQFFPLEAIAYSGKGEK